MTAIEIEGGDLHATADDRIVSGLILPFGETAATNRGRVSVRPGAIRIPADPDVVTYNDGHRRNAPLGRATDLHAREAGPHGPAGIYGSLRVARTPEGDDLLAEVRSNASNARRRLSAECTDLVIRAGEIVSGALYGVAACVKGAFPSASLLASAVDEGDDPDDEDQVDEVNDEDQVDEVNQVAAATPDEVVTVDTTRTYADEYGVTTSTESTQTTYTHQPKENDPVPAATVPGDLAARARNTTSARTRSVDEHSSMNDLFAAVAQAHRNHDADLLAALTEVTNKSHTPNVAPPDFVGELWDGVGYERQYIDLFNHADLTSWEVKGWRWKTRPTVAKWAADGDGARPDVPTNKPETEPVTIDAERYAGAHKIDRKFRDFGDTTFLESFYRAQTESYAEVTDLDVLAQVVAAAGPRVGFVAPPAGSPGEGAPNALVALVKGYFKVFRATRRRPTFALMSDDLYEPLLYTTQYEMTPYLEKLLGLNTGELGEGFLRPTVDLAPDSVLVGVKDSATVHEMGGGAPIRVTALDVAKGAEDDGVFGYAAVNIHAAKGLALMDGGTIVD